MAIYTLSGTITHVSPIVTITTRSGEPLSKRTVVITQRRFNPTSGVGSAGSTMVSSLG